MTNKIRLGICILILLTLQSTVVHRFSYRFLSFDLLSLLVAFLALEASAKGALCCAMGIGLLRDLASYGRLGGSALIYIAAASGLLFVRGRLFRENIWTDLLLVFLFVCFCGVVQAVGIAIVSPGPQLHALLPSAVGTAALTAAISPLFFYVFERAQIIRAGEAGGH